MSLEYRIGDVFQRMAEIPDGSIDLVVSSPPFLALRSYLPSDHPDKHREIGSEATPADFIDTLLALTAEFDRVLAPHGSICIELGDTFAGSGGGGGDLLAGGAKDAHGSWNDDRKAGNAAHWRAKNAQRDAWPLAKSLTGIPTLYTWSLAYGRNLLTGAESKAGKWRIRNVIVWARPNPPVGALGDKFRPATSYITVACKSAKRYFDLDAVRTPLTAPGKTQPNGGHRQAPERGGSRETNAIIVQNDAGAPPLDWHAEQHPEDGDWLWKLPTQPYAGSHYATFPLALPKRLIEAMCPQRVCTTCGEPSTRITESRGEGTRPVGMALASKGITGGDSGNPDKVRFISSSTTTTGWTDCDCPDEGRTMEDPSYSKWRTGVVLDPFAGSGTTLEAAQAVGRHAIGIDLDARNGHLAQERVGMFLDVTEGAA